VEIAARFAGNLSRHREDAGLSQEELGLRASLHRTEISQLERGLRVPRIDTLVKLAASLGISALDLLNGIGWEPGHREYGRFKATPISPGDEAGPSRAGS
jgi:transcriptional regulator with XRE-family HTH domain